ncbi:UPF0699 transmembrane protein YdbS [Halolactibacillus alkaliphilus]|uniref:UPF0699 transmembrane protein YdbS n=1 Tax=Halolactibacillus alkaliphilus TaxID=442899 RepID=A0A511X439_9BACI|nr:PH domain-containing protein [Halolactibacillus alkaliphilus]GEN57707.1 UPF0699 transmembrane protein YdbS [Halolactibacillus alkaliphilus]GGN74834.1 UPF0699 transmembrane protein YdbS [Halolactibacillus alkaliphilus]SFP03520.1 hypothetical protein SAMN05720591_13512 [Halolactibacillus alkaliphilus]
MRQPPAFSLDKQAIKVWQIHGGITFGLLLVFHLIFSYIVVRFEWSYVFIVITSVLIVLIFIIQTWLIPKIRYRRFRYEISDEEIYIQRGIIIVTRTLVPMTRIQHVDTTQGPVLKRYKLMTVTISTAATTHEIPALSEGEADGLRNEIAVLARVTDDE